VLAAACVFLWITPPLAPELNRAINRFLKIFNVLELHSEIRPL